MKPVTTFLHAILLVGLVCMLCAIPVHADIHYVMEGGTGSGSSLLGWHYAAGSIQTVINYASSGDEIWVAAGTYTENLTVPAGIMIFGGFSGDESARDDRNWKTSVTTITGGAISVTGSSSAMSAIDGFKFTDCSSFSFSGNVVFSHNIVPGNIPQNYVDPLVICSGSVTLVNNIICGASHPHSDEAPMIYCVSNQGEPSFTNNIIINNAGECAVAIDCSSCTGAVHISNNIVHGGIGISGGSYAVLTNNCVYGCACGEYTAIPLNWTPPATEINSDPLFVDASNDDYHLQSSSPCANAGDDDEINSASIPDFAKSKDLDCKPRITGENVEVGAYEFAVIYVKTDGDDEDDGLSWDTAKDTLDGALDIAQSGDEVWVAAGTSYSISTSVPDGVSIYGGFAGTESSRDARDWVTNLTVISGGTVGATATNAAITIDGFKFTGTYYFSFVGDVTFSHNVLAGCYIHQYDDTLILCDGSVTIANNLIYGTTVHGEGMRIIMAYDDPVITNNTIVGNNSTTGTVGIFCNNSGAQICNNIIAFNSSAGGGGCGIECYYEEEGPYPTLSHNCIYDNDYWDYMGIDSGWITGDINVNPLLVGGGDYHLQSTSPCINSGSNTASGLPSVDIDNDTRVLYGTVDIGADEYVGLIHDAKSAPDGAYVSLNNAVVTAIFPDYFYIEAENRTSGIKVVTEPAFTTVDVNVTVFGTIETDGGERYINADSVVTNCAQELTPLAMNNETIGGGAYSGQAGITGAVGWNNIGLLIRTCGTVTDVDSSSPPTWFEICDGSPEEVKVTIGSGMTAPSLNEHVMVTGISSCEVEDTTLCRLIRSRSQADIQIVDVGHTVSFPVYAGYNYISAPLAPFSPDPMDLFTASSEDLDTRLFLWDSSTQLYIYWDMWEEPAGSSFGNIVLGKGYEWYVDNDRTVSYTGFADGLPSGYDKTDMVISLPGSQSSSVDGGWHWIGVPFNHDIPVDSGSYIGDLIFLTDGTTLKTWGEAVNAGWCESMFHGFDPINQGGTTVAYNEFGDGTWLIANQCYEFCTFMDGLALIIPASAYDTVAPNVTVEQAADQSDPTDTSPINFTVLFSEPVTGFDGSDVVLGGTACPTTAVVTDSGDHMAYSVAVSGMSIDGIVSITVPADSAADSSNNSNTASTSVDNQVIYRSGQKVIHVNWQTGNDSNDGFTWEHPKLTIQGAIDAALTGDEVWVAAGTYERIALLNPVAVYGGFCGQEITREERQWIENETIIDSEGSQVAIGIGTSYAGTVIDGFIVRHGGNQVGGFLYCSAPSEISHNKFENDSSFYNYSFYIMAAATMHDNLIIANTPNEESLSVGVSGNAGAIILNNTIINAWVICDSTAVAKNNIIASWGSTKSASMSGAPYYNNCIYSFDAPNIIGVNGNISGDPLFVDRSAGDYSLQSNSPCIDAGTDSIDCGETDAFGNIRKVDVLGVGNEETNFIDIGAYELPDPSSPTTVIVTAPIGITTDFAPMVTWQASGSFTHYQVYVENISNPLDYWNSGCVVSSNSETRIVRLLTNGATYTVKVRVYDSSGWGAWSNTAEFNILFTDVPLPDSVPYCSG
ncbi:hypothetical protein LLG46_12155 [bacterium]|nr:hypothetical protein [bacterium]